MLLTFRTENNEYIYNDITGEVILYSVDKMKELVNLSVSQSIQCDIIEKQIRNWHSKNVTNSLVFEITKQCNLRCKYCILSEKFDRYPSYLNTVMPWHVIKDTLDWYIREIEKGKRLVGKPTIGFFGGEPFLHFELIEKAVHYMKSRYEYIPVSWSITTNLTILLDEWIDFLVANDIFLSVSYNGPKELHDMFRVFANSNGSWDMVSSNLQRIYVKAPDYFNKNVVAIVRYDEYVTDMVKLIEHWQDRKEWVPNIASLGPIFWYDISGRVEYEKAPHPNSLALYRDSLVNEFFDLVKHKEVPPLVELHLFLPDYLKIVARTRNTPIRGNSILGYTATCLPGSKIYVTPDGQFHLCENAPQYFPFGNPYDGLNLERIKNLVCGYAESIVQDCSYCPIARLCDVCYARVMVPEGFRKFPKDMCEMRVSKYKRLFTELWTNFEQGVLPEDLIFLASLITNTNDELLT